MGDEQKDLARPRAEWLEVNVVTVTTSHGPVPTSIHTDAEEAGKVARLLRRYLACGWLKDDITEVEVKIVELSDFLWQEARS